jgi:Rod binding domain-containing protein
VTINHLSAGRIPDGATVERSVPTPMAEGDSIQLDLNASDYGTAREVVRAINAKMGSGTADALDGRVVRVRMPASADARVSFMAEIENLDIRQATPSAKVVINARTGSIVMNQAVTLAACAVAHGSLSVVINTTPTASQPGPFARAGQTVVTEKADITITQQAGSLVQMAPGAKLADVVKALNSLGATPQDLLAILQALKSAGRADGRARGHLMTAASAISSPSGAAMASSSGDATSIAALRSAAARDPKAAIRETARQFEALFMQQLMKSMREATMSSGMLDNSGSQLGTEMLDTQYANKMSGLPGGLAAAIARQLERQMGAGAAAALAAPASAAAAGAPSASASAPSAEAVPLSARQIDFIRSHQQAARASEAASGIPASFMVAQAAHESAWGQREIRNADGTSAHNLFGIKAGPGLERAGRPRSRPPNTSAARRRR